MDSYSLNDLERELLELCAVASQAGETTTSLHEEMLRERLDRRMVEASLRRLVALGLMTTSRGIFGGVQHLRDGRVVQRACIMITGGF
jgi:hypothetical protein